MRGIIETAGTRIAYRLAGPRGAPVLVLSTSLGTTQALWDAQLPVLSGYLRVLTYDHRGHGGSGAPPGPYSIRDMARDLIDLLDALDIERASLCGLSMGGAVALEAARRRPERVDRLVLACTALRLGPADRWRRRAAAVRAGGTASILGEVMPRWFDEGFRARQPERVAATAAMLAGCDGEGYALCCEALAGHDGAPTAEAPSAPTLVLAGAGDVVVSPEAALELATAIPGASLSVLAG
ncbi:MAG TPA: alpha/beta fold hydrolase, partial [Candidatus Dormibacteraeota bacterium]|nr:alpha/beta fold hydrolase [Candidatus Dormibacteraeota bacterium]